MEKGKCIMKKTSKIFIVLTLLAGCILALLALFGVISADELEENFKVIIFAFGILLITGLALSLLAGKKREE